MERKPTKISIIGAGAVGSAVAFSIATQRLVSEIVIIDVNTEKAEGEAMDISAPVRDILYNKIKCQ